MDRLPQPDPAAATRALRDAVRYTRKTVQGDRLARFELEAAIVAAVEVLIRDNGDPLDLAELHRLTGAAQDLLERDQGGSTSPDTKTSNTSNES